MLEPEERSTIFFNDPAPTELYPLPLHDALPILRAPATSLASRTLDHQAVRWAPPPPRRFAAQRAVGRRRGRRCADLRRSRARVQLRGDAAFTKRAWTEDREAQWRPCRRPTPRSGGLHGRADERRQLTSAMHLAHDVAAADELAVHVQLRNGRPVRVLLDRFPLLRLGEHVDGLERGTDLAQDLDRGGREAAHRKARGPLHVEDHLVLPDLALDILEHVGHRRLSL